MIAISNQEGHLVKTIAGEGVVGFHKQYGFIPEGEAHRRDEFRKRRGFAVRKSSGFGLKFFVDPNNGKPILKPVDGCEIKETADGKWLLKSAIGEYWIGIPTDPDLARLGKDHEEDDRRKLLSWMSLYALLFLVLALWLGPRREVVAPPKQEEPVVVKIEIPKESVKIPQQLLKNVPEVAKQNEKMKRAIQQNLGFLGLLGKQNLKGALGGVPTTLKDASPGAGPGGKEGSGGELLVGLGQGVKRTTVGNTGTAGLGGIGTKGVGGGAGGYGNSMIASGEGKGLTSMPLSQDMVLEGGLDMAVIQATIAKYQNQVRACYEEGLRRNPALAGVVGVFFEINAAGNLNFANVKKSSLGDAGVEKCLTGKMMSWQFPKPRGGVNQKVNYPFQFRPQT